MSNPLVYGARLSLISFLLALACSNPTSPAVGTQGAIHLTFDLHCDPLSPIGGSDIETRRTFFRRQLANAQWLLDTVAPYGAKISFLAVGEFYEFCVEDSAKDTCLPLLQRLKASGGIIGTHHHPDYYNYDNPAGHDWVHVTGTATAEMVDWVWRDGNYFARKGVQAAFPEADTAAVTAINAAAESQVHLASSTTAMMEKYGYTIRQGGGDQTLVEYFGHVPWNPFRPGEGGATSEDLTTKFVTVPQGVVIGYNGEHLGLPQDGSPERKQAEFLELYVNWLERQRTAAAGKVWSFGWGLHTQDLDEGSPSRPAIPVMLSWLRDEFVDKKSSQGFDQARFSGYPDVRDAYLDWESRHPGTSSFNFTGTSTDYAAYSAYYLEHANRYLRFAKLDAELTGVEGVRVFKLTASAAWSGVDGHPLLVATSSGTTANVDASALGADPLRRVDLATGAVTDDVPAASAPIGPSSVVFCAPSECDAILALADVDAGVDDVCSVADPACPEDKVCATMIGTCVWDCRVTDNCPNLGKTCDTGSGLCA